MTKNIKEGLAVMPMETITDNPQKTMQAPKPKMPAKPKEEYWNQCGKRKT